MQKNKYSCFELHGLQNIRLNPLDSFPKETDFRFVLFVLAILGADLFIYGNFYHTFFGESSISPSYLISLVLWMLGGCFFNFIIAGISYFYKPGWQIRKENLTLLKDDNFPGITSYLEQLCDQVNLANRPTFLWDTDDLSFDGGQVFGRLHHYYIRLPDGVVECFKKPETCSKFQGIVLHELGHIRNHDVDKIQLTNTIFWSFLITSIPILIISLLQSPFQRIGDMGWRFSILILLVYLIRRSILRVREFYADLRASIWQGKSDVLQEIFSEEKSSRKTSSNWLKQLKQAHPSSDERCQILNDPTPLFQMSFWTMFATGMATTPLFFLFGMSIALLVDSQQGSFDFNLLMAIPALVFAVPLGFIAGVGIWRMTFAALVAGKRIRNINKLAAGLACGMLVGLQCSPLKTLDYFASLSIVIPFGILLWIVITTFFRWIVISAQVWFPIAITSHSPRRIYRWGFLVASGVLVGCLTGVFSALIYVFSALFHNSNFPNLPILIADNPSILFTLIGIWAFPLAAYLKYPQLRNSQISNWLFLDPIPSSVSIDWHPQLQPIRSAMIGIVGGLVGWVLFLTLKVSGVESSMMDWMSVAIAIQIIGAVVAVLYTSHLRCIHGLFSAFVAGCLLAIALIMLGDISLNVSNTFIAMQTINRGGLLALPTVILISTLTEWIRPRKFMQS